MSKLMENNNIKKVVLLVYDLITLILVYIFAIMIAYPLATFKEIFIANMTFGIISIVTSVLLYIIFKLYNSLWKYASISELMKKNVTYMFSSVVMYGCESWTIKKAEHQRIDAFEL